MKPDVFGFRTEEYLNMVRGKVLVGHATRDEILSVFGHMDALQDKLDELDAEDTFGTEGWRHRFGLPEGR